VKRKKEEDSFLSHFFVATGWVKNLSLSLSLSLSLFLLGYRSRSSEMKLVLLRSLASGNFVLYYYTHAAVEKAPAADHSADGPFVPNYRAIKLYQRERERARERGGESYIE
jgi:hypothetical protein